MATKNQPSKTSKAAQQPKSAKGSKARRDAKAADQGQQTGSKNAQLKRRAKRTLSKGAKIALVAVGCLAMVLSITAMACSGVINEATDDTGYNLTGGVAATVNGAAITEDTITKEIMSYRSSGGYDSDKAWAQYLVDNGMTPESYRKSMIDSYAQQLLLQQAEKENDITVSDDDVNKAYEKAASSYGSTDEFTSLLKQIGYTEDSYKQSLKSSLAQQKLEDAVAPATDPTDDEIVAYLNENLTTYNDARRSSQILFKVDSNASDKKKEKVKEKAQKVLDKINSGELSFEDAVKKYSEDDGSKKDGGDVGWDKLTTFVDGYQTALEGLSKGQMSGLVESTYGYHIILCTDYFHVDDQVTSIDQVPKKIRNSVRDTLKTQNQSTAYNEWLTKYTDSADIVINDMPKDVPYNVSLDGVEPSSSSSTSGADTGSTDTSGE